MESSAKPADKDFFLITQAPELRLTETPGNEPQQYKLPPAEVMHEVQESDTLLKIAFTYGTSISSLKNLNNIAADEFLYPGMMLKVNRRNSSEVYGDTNASELLGYAPPTWSGPLTERGSSVTEAGGSWSSKSFKHLSAGSEIGASPLSRDGRAKSVLLRDPKKELNTKGEISDINTIFEKVISSSRMVNESIKEEEQKSKEQKDSFLNAFSSFSKGEILDEKELLESLEAERPDSIKTEVYYCTQEGKVKGILTVNPYLVMFDPIKCKENEKFVDLITYQCCIDLQDVRMCQTIQLQNES